MAKTVADFKPMRGDYLIEIVEFETMVGRIHIPGTAQSVQFRCGKVIKCGAPLPAINGAEIPLQAEVGDVVMLGHKAGINLRFDDGSEYVIITEEKVAGIFKGGIGEQVSKGTETEQSGKAA